MGKIPASIREAMNSEIERLLKGTKSRVTERKRREYGYLLDLPHNNKINGFDGPRDQVYFTIRHYLSKKGDNKGEEFRMVFFYDPKSSDPERKLHIGSSYKD